MKQPTHVIITILLSTSLYFSTAETPNVNEDSDTPRSEALKVLKAKCNVCHRKQNPFMVFNAKNMTKRVTKINNAVFISQRMPKGNKYNLTPEEKAILMRWIDKQ